MTQDRSVVFSGYSIQHYVIEFVSDSRQVGGFLWVLWFPPSIKLTDYITEILLKVALNTINHKPPKRLVVTLYDETLLKKAINTKMSTKPMRKR